jgi:NADPH:quinone reductase-like Zn-dependent oxidoreductase
MTRSLRFRSGSFELESRRYLSRPNHADLAVLKGFIESGTLRPVIDRAFPLQETPAGLRYIEAGHVARKRCLTVT